MFYKNNLFLRVEKMNNPVVPSIAYIDISLLIAGNAFGIYHLFSARTLFPPKGEAIHGCIVNNFTVPGVYPVYCYFVVIIPCYRIVPRNHFGDSNPLGVIEFGLKGKKHKELCLCCTLDSIRVEKRGEDKGCRDCAACLRIKSTE